MDFVIFFFLQCICVLGQDIEVKKFEPMEKDQMAALSTRKDINGVTCGLVKVQLKESGLSLRVIVYPCPYLAADKIGGKALSKDEVLSLSDFNI